MVAAEQRRIWAAVMAISGSFLVTHAASTVEVESDTVEGRTAAAIADFRNAIELEPDLKRGAELFTTCAACHAANGLGTEDGSIPAIAGQHVSVLVKQLVDFRHDRRWNKRMRNFASQHSLSGPQELLDVAAYAESLHRWPPLKGGTGDGSMLNEGNASTTVTAQIATGRWGSENCVECGRVSRASVISTYYGNSRKRQIACAPAWMSSTLS